jgi:hypothetical protein
MNTDWEWEFLQEQAEIAEERVIRELRAVARIFSRTVERMKRVHLITVLGTMGINSLSSMKWRRGPG